MRYDPAASLKKIKCPVLALNGEKNIQVDADMSLIVIKQHISENGNKNVTIKTYPKLSHLFQACEKGILAEYEQLEETIDPEALKDMTEWIKEQQIDLNQNHSWRTHSEGFCFTFASRKKYAK